MDLFQLVTFENIPCDTAVAVVGKRVAFRSFTEIAHVDIVPAIHGRDLENGRIHIVLGIDEVDAVIPEKELYRESRFVVNEHVRCQIFCLSNFKIVVITIGNIVDEEIRKALLVGDDVVKSDLASVRGCIVICLDRSILHIAVIILRDHEREILSIGTVECDLFFHRIVFYIALSDIIAELRKKLLVKLIIIIVQLIEYCFKRVPELIVSIYVCRFETERIDFFQHETWHGAAVVIVRLSVCAESRGSGIINVFRVVGDHKIRGDRIILRSCDPAAVTGDDRRVCFGFGFCFCLGFCFRLGLGFVRIFRLFRYQGSLCPFCLFCFLLVLFATSCEREDHGSGQKQCDQTFHV